MKRLFIFTFFVLFTFHSFADNLPKNSFGKYAGVVPAYTLNVDGNELEIESSDLFITIDTDEIMYKSGKLVLSGSYTVLKQNKNEYVVKGVLSNGKSVELEISFIYFKKEAELLLTAKNGRDAIRLVQL